MSKRRSLERGAGETSGRASKLLCPGIAGSNAKRAGPFVLGKRWGLRRGRKGERLASYNCVRRKLGKRWGGFS